MSNQQRQPQPWKTPTSGPSRDFETAPLNQLNPATGVSVMLFEGFGLHLTPPPDNVLGHPFHSDNNINHITIGSIVDYQVLPINPRIQAQQVAYIQKVIDTVHDLPNVLYEVANESAGGGAVDRSMAEALALGPGAPPDWGDSTQWQYWVIEFLKCYAQEMGYEQHPVGMTMQFP